MIIYQSKLQLALRPLSRTFSRATAEAAAGNSDPSRAAVHEPRSAAALSLRAVPLRRGGHRRGRPAAENHQVVLATLSVSPIRWLALLNRLLVVNVHREKLDGYRVCPP